MPVKKLYREHMSSYFFIALLTFFSACGLLGSDDKAPLEPGPRNYTWTVDTLSSPSNLFYLFSMWGNSPANIWALGPADASENALWHYHGGSWGKTTYRLSSNMQSIYGFDSTNIWACDSPGGNIYHYGGMNWTETGSFEYPDYSITYLNNIWGPTPDEIYIAGGAYDQEKGALATLLKYNGTEWKYVDLPHKEMSFAWVRKSMKNDLLYVTAIQFSSSGDEYKIFTYNGNKLKEIYSGEEPAYAYDLGGRIYINIGKKIFKHQNDQLVLWKDFSQTTYLGMIFGRNEKDFFGVASDGLAHFNGTNIQTIYPTNLSINYVFVMGKDVFAIGDYRVIIHGTLNEE